MTFGKKMKNGNTYTKTFYSEGGIVEFVEMLDKNGRPQSLNSQSHLL